MSLQRNVVKPSMQSRQDSGLVPKFALAVRGRYRLLASSLLVLGVCLFAGGCKRPTEQVQQVIPVSSVNAGRVSVVEPAPNGVAHAQRNDVELASTFASVLVSGAEQPAADQRREHADARHDVAVPHEPEVHWFVLIPCWIVCFAIGALLSAGGPSAILRDRRERKEMFARDAAASAAAIAAAQRSGEAAPLGTEGASEMPTTSEHGETADITSAQRATPMRRAPADGGSPPNPPPQPHTTLRASAGTGSGEAS